MRVWLTLAVMLLGIAACGGRTPADRPPEIRYGEDACDECHMLVNEPRFAAAYVTENGETRRFDDIGDMVLYYTRTGERVEAFWVHDYEMEEWLRAEKATFVRSPDVHTPMGHGIVAFANPAKAEAFARQHGGEVLTFDELLALDLGAGSAGGRPVGSHGGHTHEEQGEPDRGHNE